MADQKGTSRTLNYALSGDIMNRVKGALDDGSSLKKVGDAMTGVGDALTEGSKQLLDTAVQHKNMKESADMVYEQGMDAFGSRASWATPGTYDKFLGVEEEQRSLYNDAIAKGDKKLAAKILREQQQRGIQQQTWKGVFEGLKDIQLLDLEGEDAYTIGRMTSQEGEDFQPIYEDGELKIRFLKQNPNFDPTKDEDETNSRLLPNLPENYITIRGTEFDKLIAKNRKPITEQKEIAASTQVLMDKKAKLEPFDLNTTLLDNKNLITKDNIHSMMKGELGLHNTGSFLNSINSHPDFEGIKFAQSFDSAKDAGMELEIGENSTLNAADTDPKDGVISGDEFMKLTDNDKNEVIKLMQEPENFDIAQHYLAEFVTLAQKRKLEAYNPRIGNSNKRYDEFINQVITQE